MNINPSSFIKNPLLQTIVNEMSEVLVILDYQFQVVLLNDSAEKLLHYPLIEAYGKPFSEICHKTYFACFISDYIKTHANNSFSQEISTLIANTKLTWRVFSIETPEGLFHVFKTINFFDKENKNTIFHLELLIENMPCNVYWVDKNCLMLGCNQNVLTMLNMTIEQFRGKSYEELSFLCNWPEGLASKLKNDDLTVLHSGEGIYGIEDPPIPHSNNTFLHLLTSRVPLRNKNGEIIGVAGISTDITALKDAKEKSAASRAKSEFIANMSHDFVTPLTGIINMSSDLIDEQATSNNRQRAEWLNKSGEQLLELCTGILESVSADNYTEKDLNEECFNLHEFIEAIEELERPLIQSKKLEFKVDIAKSIPPFLITDRVKLHRVFLNLLGNAIKFTQTGYIGVKIKLLKKNKKKVVLDISVVDTGRGIALEFQEKIFERFFRVIPYYKGIDKGYGIGLDIAQKYVYLLGGEKGIQLESEEGKGSRFYFTLSFKIGNEKDAVQMVAEQEQPIELPKKTKYIKTEKTQSSFSPQQEDVLPSNAPLLLLIEDTPPALLGLESIVKKAGCRFKSAVNGEQGLELAKKHDFDLIITDIGLPGISGIEVAKQIRDWEKTQHTNKVPIVALTAHAAQMTEPECLEAGMDQVFTKPANLNMVKHLIQQFIIKNKDSALTIVQKIIPPKTEISITSKMGLGHDLPDTEEELFMLDQYLFFDIKGMEEIYGDNSEMLIKKFLESMSEQITKDKKEIAEAFTAKDWDQVEKLAHRVKGGAVCCAALRMKYACQYLERYRKAGLSKSLEKLYYQLMNVLDESKAYLDAWLSKHPTK